MGSGLHTKTHRALGGTALLALLVVASPALAQAGVIEGTAGKLIESGVLGAVVVAELIAIFFLYKDQRADRQELARILAENSAAMASLKEGVVKLAPASNAMVREVKRMRRERDRLRAERALAREEPTDEDDDGILADEEEPL